MTVPTTTTPLTDDQERTREFAVRLARVAAGVLYGDEDAWGTSPDPHGNASGFIAHYDTGGTVKGYWQSAYVREPGDYLNRAEVQAFDTLRSAARAGDEISAKVSVGRYPYAVEMYLSSSLTDDSIRVIIRTMDTLFSMNRNRTAAGHRADAQDHAENSAPDAPSRDEDANPHTGTPNATTGTETDA